MDKATLDKIIADGVGVGYVTYLPDGSLDGGYWQLPPPEHYDRMILVANPYPRMAWYNFRANDARDDIIEIPYVPPPPSENDYVNAVQVAMDQKATERRYTNLLSACTYALSTVPKFKAEGEACVAWRDAVWVYCYDQFDKFQAGEIEQPTIDALVASIPQMQWPVDDEAEPSVQSGN